MANLYELTDELANLQSLIELAGGELTDEVEDALDAMVLNKETAADKLEGYGKVLANFNGEAAALKSEEKRLADKRKVIENTVARLKARVSEYMLIAGESKIKAGTFTFAMQNSPPSLDVVDQDKIPMSYYVEQAPTLDRKGILDALKAGEEVMGCAIKQGKHLRIR